MPANVDKVQTSCREPVCVSVSCIIVYATQPAALLCNKVRAPRTGKKFEVFFLLCHWLHVRVIDCDQCPGWAENPIAPLQVDNDKYPVVALRADSLSAITVHGTCVQVQGNAIGLEQNGWKVTISGLLKQILRSRPTFADDIWFMDPSEGPGTLSWVPGPLSLAGEVSIFIQLLMPYCEISDFSGCCSICGSQLNRTVSKIMEYTFNWCLCMT